MLKSPKQYRLKLLALATALACSSFMVNAAGLGRITVFSALGQPLRAELEVTANSDELNSLSARLAPAEAFRIAGVEYVSALSSLNFSRTVSERNGKRYIEITTDRPVNEPFIDMLVELNWASGRLVREYTFLLDPPELAQKIPAVPLGIPQTRPGVDGRVGISSPAPVAARTHMAPVPATSPLKPAPELRKSTPLPAPAVEAQSATRLVKSGDTLGRIASESRPEGVSLDQMLVALFRSNADAFDGNMNRMRAGKILSLPDANEVRAIDAGDARREVVAQAADFNAYRRKLAEAAVSAPASEESGGRLASGKIAPKVEDKAPVVAAGKDKLEVSRTETVAAKPDAKGSGKSAPLQGRLSALEEDLVSRERALREASSRIAQLEKNLVDLKKLAQMKSEAGAAMQKQAEAVVPSPEKTAEVSPKLPEPEKIAGAPSSAAEAAKAEPATSTETPTSPPAPKPKKKVVPIPEPEPEPDFIEENAPLVFGGAGVLALLLGYLGFSAYRRKKKTVEEIAPISQADLSTNSVFSDAASESINATAASSGEFSISEADLNAGGEAVDPLVEADTYLAFGRDAQAEEILLDALQKEPARHAIHLKLLEIYSARRSAMQFNTLARELRDQTGGQGAEWERTLVMGLALDPNNPLYQVVAQAPPAVSDEVPVAVEVAESAKIDPDATMVFSAPPPLAAGPEVDAVVATDSDTVASLDFDLDLGDMSTASVVAADKPVIAVADDSAGLDFNLDLDEPATKTDAALNQTPTGSADSALALDIDFDLDSPSSASAATESAPDVVAASLEVEIPVGSDAMAMDIDFDSTPSGPAVEVESVALAAPEDISTNDANSINFALDIELPAVAEPAPATLDIALEPPELPLMPDIKSAAVGEAENSASASVDFDFDLGEEMPDVQAQPEVTAPALDLESISLELDAAAPATENAITDLDLDLDLDLPALDGGVGVAAGDAPVAEADAAEDNPEAATKLELALAYEEMGDRDGARELLEEVLKEGSSAQREAAQAKLDSLT